MLNLQAQTLEQQERLYKNQIRLNIREILQEELNFYSQALANISSTASVLGGFCLTSMQLAPVPLPDNKLPLMESLYYFFALAAVGICLLTVVFAQFSSLFSMRLALRGGETSVETTVAKMRGEYNRVLTMLVTGIELFLLCIPFMAYCKLQTKDALICAALMLPTIGFVFYFYWRASSKFYLASDATFMSATKETAQQARHRRRSAHQRAGGGGGDDLEGGGGRGVRPQSSSRMEYLQEIDHRNEDKSVPQYSNRPQRRRNNGGEQSPSGDLGFSRPPHSHQRQRSKSEESVVRMGPATRETSVEQGWEERRLFPSFRFSSFSTASAAARTNGHISKIPENSPY